MTQACCTGPFRNAVRVGLDCSRCMERTVQVHAVHCVSKQNSDIVASPGTMLAPALSTDREEQQQHVLTPASAKPAPAQRHSHRTLQQLWGSKAQSRAYTHVCAHTHIHKDGHACTRMHTHTNVARVMGFANFWASLATLPHLSIVTIV